MRVRTNELLTLSRLPVALWTDIHKGREHFDNPGSSVLSMCVFGLKAEFIDVPEDVQEAVQQCRDFSTKREHIAVIIEFLEVQAATLAGQSNNLVEAQQKWVFRELSDVVRLNQELKRLVAAFEVNSVMPSRLDASSQIYPTFVQAILELKSALDILAARLGQISETNTPPAKA